MGTSTALFMDVISDKRFCALLRLSQRQALRWDEFLGHQLPEGLSPLETWKALHAIGKCLGIHLFEDADGVFLWYRRNYELEDVIDAIAQRTNDRSELHRIVFGKMDSSFFGELRAREVEAILALDGFARDEGDAEGESERDQAVTRIAENYVALDADLPRYQDADFSDGLFEELLARLTEGVDLVSTPESARWSLPADEPRRAYLQRLVAYENSRNIREDTGVLKGVLLGREIQRFSLFGSASNLMSSILARQFYLHRRMPILAIAPLTELRLRWTRGTLGSSPAPDPAVVDETFRQAPGNITLRQTVSAYWMMAAIDDIEEEARENLRLTELVRDGLMGDRRFNNRQRLVVARALSAPHAEFHARYHQLKHAVSYATARRDLVKLADEGFLVRKKHGKDVVFVPSDAIEELVRATTEHTR